MYTHVKLNESKVPMLVWNSRGIIISSNHAASQLLGYEEKYLIGKNIASVAPPDKCAPNLILDEITRNEEQEHSDRFVSSEKTATLVGPNKNDDIYVLFCFGSYIEYDRQRFLFAFLSTSSEEKPFAKISKFIDSTLTSNSCDIDNIDWIIT